jgi:stage III sporulation protein AA
MQMMCQWEALLGILPLWMRQDIDRLGNDSLQELRLYLGSPPLLKCKDRTLTLNKAVTADDLKLCINAASRYSPWAAATSASGYITCIGGHRVGICGEVILQNGMPTGVTAISSICIRVSRDIKGIACKLSGISGGVLMVGKPGSGKTTLLRDYIRIRSNENYICVVDERREIFPRAGESICFYTGPKTDVLSGVPKQAGIEMALRSMSPQVIAVDEITSSKDCRSIMQAGWCGVELVATAHASGREELMKRPLYKPLVNSGLFQWLVILREDKSFRLERM